MPQIIQIKKCSRCHEIKVGAEFNPSRATRASQGDGLTSWCKKCYLQPLAGQHCSICGVQAYEALCGRCNKMLGFAGDDVGVLLAAAEYLRRAPFTLAG